AREGINAEAYNLLRPRADSEPFCRRVRARARHTFCRQRLSRPAEPGVRAGRPLVLSCRSHERPQMLVSLWRRAACKAAPRRDAAGATRTGWALAAILPIIPVLADRRRHVGKHRRAPARRSRYSTGAAASRRQ